MVVSDVASEAQWQYTAAEMAIAMGGGRRVSSATRAPLDSRSRLRLRRALLSWYDRSARLLPWRRTRAPYRIWIAEVMLQQTRIAVVLPAYERFLHAFPTIAELAHADEERVLSLWSGLGYYSRARALRRAAIRIQSNGGRFPNDLAAALQLPGVGPYTAAAVLSIAFDRPHATVDGNVIRVLSRLFCLQRPDGRGEPHVSLAAALLDRKRPGDWNQALMELGEVVCLPKSPRCQACPVRAWCAAFAAARVDAYPPPRPRKQPERLRLRLTLLHDRRGRLLLERGAFRFLPHLWLPPIRVVAGSRAEDENDNRACGRFRHSILHRQFDVEVSDKLLAAHDLENQARRPSGGESRIFAPDQMARIGRSSLLAKACALLEQKQIAPRSGARPNPVRAGVRRPKRRPTPAGEFRARARHGRAPGTEGRR
jgi:A/G-specific adenine glycosylase